VLQVSVGRLGIITQLTLSIVPQQAVRRAEQDTTIAQFAQQVKQVQDAYTQAKQTGSTEAIWTALHSLNETQIRYGAQHVSFIHSFITNVSFPQGQELTVP